MRRERWILAPVLLAVVLVGGSVAGEQAPPAQGAEEGKAGVAAPEDDVVMALKRRAAGYWQARVKGDTRAQFEYLEPRVRGRSSPEEYQKGRGAVQYLAYQVEDARVDGSFAVVTVRLLVRLSHPALGGKRLAPQAALVEDTWVRLDGAWYRVEDSPAARRGRSEAGG